MQRCGECGTVFDEPGTFSEEDIDWENVGTPDDMAEQYERIGEEICPECGAGNWCFEDVA